jgi:hypothetical protein
MRTMEYYRQRLAESHRQMQECCELLHAEGLPTNIELKQGIQWLLARVNAAEGACSRLRAEVERLGGDVDEVIEKEHPC